MDLVIIGAGLAGLAAAHRLRATRPDLQVVVYEKSPDIGGRAATRSLYGAIFDHGAQYLKTPTPELQQFITAALDHTTLVDIARPVWTFDASGSIQAGDPAQNADPKWTYTDGLGRLARELAAGSEVRTATAVDRLRLDVGGYALLGASGSVLERARALLLTPPAPEIGAIVGRSLLHPGRGDALLRELERATYRPCLSITLGYNHRPRERPFYALVNTDRGHPISWLAFEHLKPGRAAASQGVLIAQMAPGWSREHWHAGDGLGATTAALVARLLDENLADPQWWDCERWPYALPDSGCDTDRLHTDDGLFFAGDFLAGQGRMHLAIESGWAAAERIAAAF